MFCWPRLTRYIVFPFFWPIRKLISLLQGLSENSLLFCWPSPEEKIIPHLQGWTRLGKGLTPCLDLCCMYSVMKSIINWHFEKWFIDTLQVSIHISHARSPEQLLSKKHLHQEKIEKQQQHRLLHSCNLAWWRIALCFFNPKHVMKKFTYMSNYPVFSSQ